jgi:hypothetical protein
MASFFSCGFFLLNHERQCSSPNTNPFIPSYSSATFSPAQVYIGINSLGSEASELRTHFIRSLK